MLSPVSRQLVRRVATQQCRSFSSTPTNAAAAEVKRLGVIGAGQMVRKSEYCGLGAQLTILGPWNSTCCSAESLCTREADRQLTSLN